MSPRRRERVAPPAAGGEWEVRFASNDAARGWEDLCRQAAANTLDAWRAMRTGPGPVPPTSRHHRLKGSLKAGQHDGRELPRWQLEVTSKARVWYLLDVDQHTVWIVEASTGHPRATD